MNRPAVSRIEIAVIAAVGVLAAGLIVMLIARQRENGLRLQCANNLRRQGEAMHSFFANSGAPPFLPAARIADGYATWAVLIAPHLAADNALTRWDVSQPYGAQDAAVREALVPFYFCPARERSSALSVAGDVDPATGQLLPGAVGDYAGVAGTGNPAHPWDGPDADGPIILGNVVERLGDRILGWRGRTSLTAIRDARGLSVTLLVGEKHVPLGREGHADAGDGSLYNGHFAASCSRIAGPGHGLAAAVTDPFNTNFGSAHVGLCQFLLADASVRTFAVNVNESVLGQMARRDK
jgi:hypothetical protein